jgi:hypothetical protein
MFKRLLFETLVGDLLLWTFERVTGYVVLFPPSVPNHWQILPRSDLFPGEK